MKFFSKIGNYRILLTPNIPGNPYMQIPPVYGKSVKFNEGVAEVTDEEIINLMKNHRNFNKEFFAEQKDPFANRRVSSEPVHEITEMEAGRAVRSVSSKPSNVISGKLEEMIKEMAVRLIEEGGYVKAEPDPVPTQQHYYDENEPMDTALADEVAVNPDILKTSIPKPIGFNNDIQDDDGINPLASTVIEDVNDATVPSPKAPVTKTNTKKSKK